jgi:hypothetical protein
MHEGNRGETGVVDPTQQAFPSRLGNKGQKLPDFPKAGRFPHNFFHRRKRAGIPVESRNAAIGQPVNLLVTQIIKLTRINFSLIR